MIFLLLQLLTVACAFYFIGRFIVMPKFKMAFYRNQNIKEFCFFPLYGWLWDGLLQKCNKNKDPIEDIRRISQDPDFKNQDIILSNMDNEALLLIVNPDLISEFLQNQQNYIKYELPFHGLNKLIGTGLAKHYGDGWKKCRKILSNMFTFEQIALQLVSAKQVARKYLKKENEQALNVQRAFENSAGAHDLILMLGFNLDDYKDSNGEDLSTLIKSFVSDIYLRDVGVYSMVFGRKITDLNLRGSDRDLQKRGEHLKKFMREIIIDCIKREEQPGYQPEYPSFIHHLVKEGLLNTSEEIEDLLAISFNLFLAAKETTSKLATSILYHLIKYPQWYEKVYEEIQQYAPNEDYTFADVQKMNILQANVKECLRIDTSGPFLFQRVAVKDHTLGKYEVKKGTLLNAGYLVNFFNEKYFNNPFEYLPERWLDAQQDQKMKSNHFVFIPFSGGQRNCIGQHLAVMQVKSMIIEFIRNYKLPQIPKDFDTEKTMTLSYGFKQDLVVKVERR